MTGHVYTARPGKTYLSSHIQLWLAGHDQLVIRKNILEYDDTTFRFLMA